MDDLDVFIELLISAIENGTKNGIKKASFLAEREMKLLVPVDTSRLKNSIMTKIDGYNSFVGPNVYYATWVNNGTGIYAVGGRGTPWTYFNPDPKSLYYGFHFTYGQKPKHFLEDTYAKVESKLVDIVFKEISDAIDSIL